MRLNILIVFLTSAFLALGSVWSFRDGLPVVGCALGLMSLGSGVLSFYSVLYCVPGVGGTRPSGKWERIIDAAVVAMMVFPPGLGCAFFAVFVAQGGTAGSSSRVPEGTGGAVIMAVLSAFLVVMGIYCTFDSFTGKKRRQKPFSLEFSSCFYVPGSGYSEAVSTALSGRLKLITRDPFHVTTAPVADDAHLRELRFGAYGDGVVIYHVDPRARCVTINAVTWSG